MWSLAPAFFKSIQFFRVHCHCWALSQAASTAEYVTTFGSTALVLTQHKPKSTPLMSCGRSNFPKENDPRSNPCLILCQMKFVLLYCASIPFTVQVQIAANTAKCLISDMRWSAWSQCRAFAQELIALLKETTLGDTASSAGSGKSRHCKVDTQLK